MTNTTIKFSNKTDQQFIEELRTSVQAYFDNNQLSRKANVGMVVKTFCMLALTFVPYGLIMTNWFAPWEMLGLAIIMGVGTAGIGFCVSHDALHGAYSSSNRLNNFIGYSFDLLGASSYLWKITHNVIHHTYTNIQGVDEDLDVSPMLRLSSGAEHRPIHRFQHFFGFIAYSMATLNWVFAKDYQQLLKRDLGPYKNIKHPRKEVAILLFAKLFYYAYMIVLPLLVLNIAWWQFVIGFVVMHMTAGVILGVIFQLAHVVEGPEQLTLGESGNVEDSWLVHEMKTTANFARSNKLLCWYVAGLNFQIEHHLFPKTCSVHYPAIAGIVEEIANKHDVPYHHHDSLGKAIGSHFRMLKKFGQAA